MQIDFKVSVWESFDIPKEAEKQVKEAFNRGQIKTQDELFDFLYDLGQLDNKVEQEFFMDTKKELSPEENGGDSTIELYDEGYCITNID